MELTASETFFVNITNVDLPLGFTETFSVNTVIQDDPSNRYDLVSISNSSRVLLNGPNWATPVDGEVKWDAGLIYNGSKFRRYAMWDGNTWQVSSSE